jgi:hypothetical protein
MRTDVGYGLGAGIKMGMGRSKLKVDLTNPIVSLFGPLSNWMT